MHRKLNADLTVNNQSIELNPFAKEFLARTVLGGISSLRGTGNIRDLELYVERGDVKLVVNGEELPLTPFPRDIITSTIVGLVSSFKGVGKIDGVKISIGAQ